MQSSADAGDLLTRLQMLVVPTYVAPSPIHGLGVFAAEPLKAGTLIWRFDPVIDQAISADEVGALPAAVRSIALSRSFTLQDGQTVLSRDNGVFLNHSEHPNITGDSDGSFAVRDIDQDEELTEDYRLLPPGACRAFLDEPMPLQQNPSSKVMPRERQARLHAQACCAVLHRKRGCRSQWLRCSSVRAVAERS
jgi:hypothetical protein